MRKTALFRLITDKPPGSIPDCPAKPPGGILASAGEFRENPRRVFAAPAALRPGGEPWAAGSADGLPGENPVELSRTGLLDENPELLRAHLDTLPEVVGDDHATLGHGIVIDEQFRAATAALAAEYGDSGEPSGFFVHSCSSHQRPDLSITWGQGTVNTAAGYRPPDDRRGNTGHEFTEPPAARPPAVTAIPAQAGQPRGSCHGEDSRGTTARDHAAPGTGSSGGV
jgi:hypothetical protein